MSPQNLQTLYRDKIASGLLPDPAQQRALAVLGELHGLVTIPASPKTSFLSRFFVRTKPIRDIRGVYLHGDVGRGKSMLMDMFYNALPDTIKSRRVHFHAFMIEVHDYIHARRRDDDFDEGIDGVLPALAQRISGQARVLCFDEFHVTDVADAMILGRLFTALFECGVIVVATSNWPPDRLYEGGLQRDRFLPFIELLKNRMQVVHIDGPTDYRRRFLMDEGTYFWPLGEATTRKADLLFSKMTQGAVPESEALIVKGRTITVKHAARGVARFTFAQLCENPHGAEDYLEIARQYRVVFLENIPNIGYDRRNEAKRFMTLIDALYDTGTHIVVTAAAAPEKLYHGHDHGFEFERTVSRLIEMQSGTKI